MTSNFSQGLHASDLVCGHIQRDNRQCDATSSKTCLHNKCLLYIDYTILNSSKRCNNQPPLLVIGKMMSVTPGIIIQGMHAYYMTSRYVESDIVQRNVASTKACTHRLLHLCIIWATFALANIRKRQQRHLTLANSKKHHLKIPHPSRGVYTLSRVHYLMEMIGSYNQRVCACSKHRQTMKSYIGR